MPHSKDILEVLMQYASGEYDLKIDTSSMNDDNVQAIANGINMLGEEMRDKTISRDFFSNVFNSIPNFIIIYNQDRIVDANQFLFDHFHIEDSKLFLIDNRIEDLFTDKDKLFSEGFFESQMAFNGESIPVEVQVRIVKFEEQSDRFLIVAKDLSFEKQMETKLFSTIIEAQEEERKRFADDLHDSLGQELSAIKLFFTSLMTENLSVKGVNTLNIALDVLNDSIDEMRRISHNLLPGYIEISNLNEIVESFVGKMNQQDEIEFVFTYSGEPLNLPKNLEVACYRILQEFTNNSIKHAKASKIEFKIDYHKHYFYFSLCDNGIGKNLDEKHTLTGKGMGTTVSRVKAFNGEIIPVKNTKKGTSLKIRFPI